MHRIHCGIVPPHLLTRLAALRDPRLSVAARAARHALLELDPVLQVRSEALRAPVRRGSAVVRPGHVGWQPPARRCDGFVAKDT